MIDDYVEHLREVDPDFVAAFEADWDEVEYLDVGTVGTKLGQCRGMRCPRCFAIVGFGEVPGHERWHLKLSLAMYALGSALNGVRQIVESDE